MNYFGRMIKNGQLDTPPEETPRTPADVHYVRRSDLRRRDERGPDSLILPGRRF
jgi:hypothetical protein